MKDWLWYEKGCKTVHFIVWWHRVFKILDANKVNNVLHLSIMHGNYTFYLHRNLNKLRIKHQSNQKLRNLDSLKNGRLSPSYKF